MLIQGFCPLKNEIARFPIGFYLHLSDFDKSLLRETAGKEKIKSRTVKQKSVLHVWHEHSNSPSRFYTFLLEILTGDNWIYQYQKKSCCWVGKDSPSLRTKVLNIALSLYGELNCSKCSVHLLREKHWMLSSLVNKFVRLCELRHGLSTSATCTNTNLKERQQQR